MNRQFMIALVCFGVLMPFMAFAQVDAIITGQVADESGAPLIGADVYIPELRLGGATNPDGMYEIVVPAAQVLGQDVNIEAKFIGYKTMKEWITLKPGKITNNFTLGLDVLEMETLVVTGLGVEMDKAKLGVNIAKVSDKVITNSDESNVVSALAGKISGVEVTQTSGEPGASSYIRIRGATTLSFSDTQPLFVVDGVPINNSERFGFVTFTGTGDVVQQNRANDLNPEDIASMEVLKGAAASAVYGSRAGNGVVLITTKRGRPGRPRLSYKVGYTFDDVKKSAQLQRKYGQGLNGQSQVNSPFSWGPDLGSDVETFDHAFELFETGHKFENNLQVSGGTEKTTYFLSFGRVDHDGFIRGNSDYLRNTVRVKASQRVGNNLNFSGNIAFSNVDQDRIQRGSNVSGLLLGSFRTPPDFNNLPYLTEEGFHRSYRNQNPTRQAGSRGYDNPFFVAKEHQNISDVGRSLINVSIEYDPLDWLNINYRFGYDYSVDERRTVLPIGSSDRPNGRVVREKLTEKEIDGSLTITAVKAFETADMNLNLTLGQNLNHREFDEFSVIGDNMAVLGFNQLDNTATIDPSIEFAEKQRSESYFGRLFVDVWQQVYLTGSIRNDGSSTFGKSEKRHLYPSFSAAWEFTQMDALRDNNWLNFGKLRFAYGTAGRQPDPYDILTAFFTGNFISGWGSSHSLSSFGTGGFATSGTKGQPDIKPERSREIEVGLDVGFWNNRLGLDFTYYNQKTSDAIFFNPLPPSTGATRQIQNAGELENKGIELGLNLQPINMKDFKWNIRTTFSKNDNQVTHLRDVITGETLEFIGLGGFTSARPIAREGHAVSVIYGRDFVRFGRGTKVSGENIDELFPEATAGALYIAEDGYPIQDPEFRVIGDPNPDWTGSLRNTVTLWNNLEVSALIDIKSGGDIWNGTRGALSFFGAHVTTADNRDGTQVFDGFGPGQGTEVADGQAWHLQNLGSGFTGPASQFIEDGGYVKLREVSLAYTFADLPRWMGLTSINVRASARNLKTWTDYTGIDPDQNLLGTRGGRGLDYFGNPNTRSFVLTTRFNY
ncbi:MAG: SusC/RagA family TonB-linked outer membrane protein [bacterium]